MTEHVVVRHRRGRSIAAVALVVLASLLVPTAVTAAWAKRTVLDTDRFTSTVSDVALDKDVTDVIATRITREVFSLLETSPVIELPDALEPVRRIVLGAVENRVRSAVETILASDRFDSLFRAAVADAHRAALDVLDGHGSLPTDYFTVDDATITFDLRPLMLAVLQTLQEDGVIPARIDLPQPGDPPGRLAAALGIEMPDDFGQVVVYRTDDVAVDHTLNMAQRILVLVQRGVVVVVLVALAVVVGAIAMAVDRRRTVVRLGVGVALVTALQLLALRRTEKAIADRTTTAGARAIAESLGSTLNGSLGRVLLILLALGVIVALVARYAEPLVRWMGAHSELANVGAVALGIWFLWVAGLTWLTLIVAIAVIAAGLLVVRSAKRRAALPRPRADVGEQLPA